MLLYAYKKGFKKISVYTTTVGMTEKDPERIRNISFTEFMIHLTDAEGNTRIRVTKEYLNLLPKIKRSGIKNISYMTMGKIHPLLKNLLENCRKKN